MGAEPEKRTELRDRLLDAAEGVFASLGFAKATVDDIIIAAATSRATFYRYFRSKEDVFNELSRSCFRDMRAIVKMLADTGPGERARDDLEELVARYGELHVRHGGVIRAWMELSDRPDSPTRKEAGSTFGALLRGLERPISEVSAPSQVAPEVQAALLFILMERSSFYAHYRHAQVDPERLAPTLATMIHRAYFGGTPSGRRSRLRIAADDG